MKKNNNTRQPLIILIVILALIIGLLTFTSFDSKAKTQSIIYDNQNLGFRLTLPNDWHDRYEIQEEDNLIKIINNTNAKEYGGILVSIKRVVGEDINQIDLNQTDVDEKIILQENGYTYISKKPLTTQSSTAGDFATRDYNIMESKINKILDSIEPIDTRPSTTLNPDNKIIGTCFFTVEVPKDWKLTKSDINSPSWTIYGKNKIGSISLISPNSKHMPKSIYISNESEDRKVSIEFTNPNINHKDIKIFKDTFDFKEDGPYNILDFIYEAEEYINDGGEKIFGTIKDVKYTNGYATNIKINLLNLDKSQANNGKYITHNPGIVMTYNFPKGIRFAPINKLKDYKYNLYGFPYLENIHMDKYRPNDKYYFDFIIDKSGELKMFFERDIKIDS